MAAPPVLVVPSPPVPGTAVVPPDANASSSAFSEVQLPSAITTTPPTTYFNVIRANQRTLLDIVRISNAAAVHAIRRFIVRILGNVLTCPVESPPATTTKKWNYVNVGFIHHLLNSKI
ncbi:MAG: hypothetical protein JXA30_13925 [Deltaproteobacteria bacterium]|nr:hypothetical protein [Deltaproteobacteria bacterium]